MALIRYYDNSAICMLNAIFINNLYIEIRNVFNILKDSILKFLRLFVYYLSVL